MPQSTEKLREDILALLQEKKDFVARIDREKKEFAERQKQERKDFIARMSGARARAKKEITELNRAAVIISPNLGEEFSEKASSNGKKSRRSFSDSEKDKIVNYYIEHGYKATADKYTISGSVVRRWYSEGYGTKK